MTVPAALSAAVDDWLDRHASGSRREGAQRLTAAYRKGESSKAVDLGSYLVARLPATYAAVARVMMEVAERRPGFAPGNMLDAGSGPGTAAWAAVEAWPKISGVILLDNNARFLELAGELGAAGAEALRSARCVTGNIEALKPGMTADLVTAAYALAELPLPRMEQAARALWKAASQMLIVVEPGTPAGFARLKVVRAALLKEGAVPVAPCTHAMACPMTGTDWCHFSVRLARSRAHMHAKGGSVPFEDEKFAYLALARDGSPAGGARVLAPPLDQKPGLTFRLCTAAGIEARHVARRDSQAYKRHRKQGWGDRLPDAHELEDGT